MTAEARHWGGKRPARHAFDRPLIRLWVSVPRPSLPDVPSIRESPAAWTTTMGQGVPERPFADRNSPSESVTGGTPVSKTLIPYLRLTDHSIATVSDDEPSE